MDIVRWLKVPSLRYRAFAWLILTVAVAYSGAILWVLSGRALGSINGQTWDMETRLWYTIAILQAVWLYSRAWHYYTLYRMAKQYRLVVHARRATQQDGNDA